MNTVHQSVIKNSTKEKEYKEQKNETINQCFANLFSHSQFVIIADIHWSQIFASSSYNAILSMSGLMAKLIALTLKIAPLTFECVNLMFESLKYVLI